MSIRPRTLKAFCLLLALCATGPAVPAADASDQTIFLFQNRKVTVSVPAGLGFQSSMDDRGMISIQLGHPKDKISLHMTFLPDPEGRFATARSRKEFMNETFFQYVSSSVEKAMQFEELEPKVGEGTYCVFTDAALVGKHDLPRGEFLHSTTGLKAWPGVVAVFTVFSNDTDSKEYRAVMEMLRNSVQERPPPLL